MGTLLGYLTTEVADDAGDEIKYKLPYLAYEIFSCELTEVIDVIFDSPDLFASFMKVRALQPWLRSAVLPLLRLIHTGLSYSHRAVH